VEVKAARDEGAVGERGLPDERMQVPQPLLPSLSLRSSWLLPGVLESGHNIIAGEGEQGGGRGDREAGLVWRSVGRGRGNGFAQRTVAAREERRRRGRGGRTTDSGRPGRATEL